jgi:histidine triad (HIT) family protein
MEDADYHALLGASKEVAAHLKKVMQVPRIGVGVEGFAVDHVHIHLVPVSGIGQLDSSKAAPADHALLAQLAEKIKKE